MSRRRIHVFVAALAVTFGLVVGAASVAGGAPSESTGDASFVVSNHPLARQSPRPLAPSANSIRAVGGGWSDLGTQHFDLSAHVGPNGDFGHYGVKLEDFSGEVILRYRVDIDCVNVHGPGKRAVIKGAVRSVDPEPNFLGITPGHRVILGVDDESNPGDPFMLDDWFSPHSDTFPGNCKSIVYIANVNNVNSGNINISDGT